MTKILRIASVLLTLVVSFEVQASTASDALGKCLSDNTTGKDRKDLARWIFVGMSAHPDVGTNLKASSQDIDSAQRTMGTLFTRLVADVCPGEIKAVAQADGSQGIKIAFEILGRLAMQELMSNQQVSQTIGGFERYVDRAKTDRVLRSK